MIGKWWGAAWPPFFMIGLARLHAYQKGVFWLVEVARDKAKEKKVELSRLGWTVVHTEIV